MKIIERIFDVETNETKDIERDATDQEIEDFEKAKAEALVKSELEKVAMEKRNAALAKLEALGLDEEDLKVLGL